LLDDTSGHAFQRIKFFHHWFPPLCRYQ
jgi:hypothetical protein